MKKESKIKIWLITILAITLTVQAVIFWNRFHCRDLKDGVLVTSLFTYIGFTIASFAFLTQYLTFPKSLFVDLTQLREGGKGYPRILESKVKNVPKVNKHAGAIISYFFQLDYVSYALLMYIIYSDLVFVYLLLLYFRRYSSDSCGNFTEAFTGPFIAGLTIIFVMLRFWIVWEGAFKGIRKQKIFDTLMICVVGKKTFKRIKNEKKRVEPRKNNAGGSNNKVRGGKYWKLRDRLKLAATEIFIGTILLVGIVISWVVQSASILFIWMIFILLWMLAWHLSITLKGGPVTKLLDIWLELAKLTHE